MKSVRPVSIRLFWQMNANRALIVGELAVFYCPARPAKSRGVTTGSPDIGKAKNGVPEDK